MQVVTSANFNRPQETQGSTLRLLPDLSREQMAGVTICHLELARLGEQLDTRTYLLLTLLLLLALPDSTLS